MPFVLQSSSFADTEAIPSFYTCEGADKSPHLSWTAPPTGTQTLAILMDDPDAPGTWDHWVLFNIPAKVREVAEGQPGSAVLPNGGVQGVNRFGTLGYKGPCPPVGDTHTYRVFLYAVDQTIPLSAATSKAEVLAALEGHFLGEDLLTGSYKASGGR